MESILAVCIVSFLATFLVTPSAMRYLRGSGIVGIDQQKKSKPRLPTSGGLPVAFGLLGGVMAYIGMGSFLINATASVSVLMAACCSILIIVLVGFLDDANVRASAKSDRSGTVEYREGLKQWVKPILTIPAAIPLMAISVGESVMAIPFVGAVNVGLLYPLILVPLAVVVVSNVNNMLAGMNGLESGTGFLASLSLGLYCLLLGRFEGAIIALCLAGSLLAFLKYNWYPAKMLPGDSLTYLIGAGFVTAAIVGNVEMFAVVLYIPWMVEALLKLRGRFGVASLGVLQKDGTLKSRYSKIYSLTHLAMGMGRLKESQVTKLLIGIELIFCILAFLVFL